MASRQMLTHY